MSKKKLAKSVGAVAVAGAIAVGATFAWTGGTQTARNEAAGESDHGGRLHDDYNIPGGNPTTAAEGATKRVYVENYSTQDLFVRVRLREYMEIGTGAGTEGSTANKVTASDAAAPTKDDTSSWHVYKLGESSSFRKYWTFDHSGASVTYLPTFNKNEDSTIPDVNGSWQGEFEDYIDWAALAAETSTSGTEAAKLAAGYPHLTFVPADATAGTAAGVSGYEVYDADADTDDEANGSITNDDSSTGYQAGIDTRERDKYVYGKYFVDTTSKQVDFSTTDGNLTATNGGAALSFDGAVTAFNDTDADTVADVQKFYKYNTTGGATDIDITVGTKDAEKKPEKVTHEFTTTPAATIIPMSEWLEKPVDEKVGPFWVYDEDGWAYWAQPLNGADRKVTGTLINGYKSVSAPPDDWYYAIDVDMQCVTEDSIDTFKTEATDETKITANGRELLYRLAERDPITGGDVVEYRSNDVSVVQFGGFYKTVDGTTTPVPRANVPFSPSNGTLGGISGFTGTLETYNNSGTYSIGNTPTNEDNAIQWVKIKDAEKNKYMYISDRSLVANISWSQLAGVETTNKPFNVDSTTNYTLNTGVPTEIDGTTYNLRLLTGGIYNSNKVTNVTSYDGACSTDVDNDYAYSEWDRYIGGYGDKNIYGTDEHYPGTITGLLVPTGEIVDDTLQKSDYESAHNQLWNWFGNWNWCQERANGSTDVVSRGHKSARGWTFDPPGRGLQHYGFRPCFEVAITNTTP